MAPSRSSKKKRPTPIEPLGAPRSKSAKNVVKDEEELALEEAVFGRSRAAAPELLGALSREEVEVEDERETGLERTRDENLFFVDVPALPEIVASTSRSATPEFVTAFPSGSSSSTSSDGEAEPAPKAVVKSSNHRKPVWFDPADEQLTVSLKEVARLRKLRTGAGEDVVGGLEYEARLRLQYEKMHPSPAWATDARRKILKKRRAQAEGSLVAHDLDDSDVESEEEDEEMVDDLFRSTAGRKGRRGKGALPEGEIDIDRVRDANQVEATSGGVVEIGFHPTAQVLFSATGDRRLRLFQIDGTTNALLSTIHVPDLPITSAAFHPSGSSIVLTGSRPFFISYDLQSGTILRSPRGLLTGGLGGSDGKANGGMGGMERFKFSPDGSLLAIAGRRGYVHLVDWGSSGGSGNGGQVVGEVKMNVAVKGLAWAKGGKELVTLGENSEVYTWDVGSRRCTGRWRDDGGFGACGLEVGEKFSAVASTTGIVNLYDESNPAPMEQGAERTALKAIGNLTTTVTSMRFNHTEEILALASKTNKDQLKLVHLPTAKVFSNWPTQQTPLHHITALDFSKGSEYLAVGNARGKVLLYTVKHFSSRRR